MLYRKGITWPVAGDTDENTIAVSFVFESAHGDEYAGVDTDGEVETVQIVAPELADDLRALEQSGEIRWPSPARVDLHERIFDAAESVHADLGEFAGQELGAFDPAENVPSVHDIDPAHVTEDGTVVDNAAAMDARMREMRDEELLAFQPLRDRAEALRLSRLTAS